MYVRVSVCFDARYVSTCWLESLHLHISLYVLGVSVRLYVCASVFFDAEYVSVCRSASVYLPMFVYLYVRCASVCLHVQYASAFYVHIYKRYVMACPEDHPYSEDLGSQYMCDVDIQAHLVTNT